MGRFQDVALVTWIMHVECLQGEFQGTMIIQQVWDDRWERQMVPHQRKWRWASQCVVHHVVAMLVVAIDCRPETSIRYYTCSVFDRYRCLTDVYCVSSHLHYWKDSLKFGCLVVVVVFSFKLEWYYPRMWVAESDCCTLSLFAVIE